MSVTVGKKLQELESDVFQEIVDYVGHLLPEQAPLRRFVHHNTLHAFEHLPFEEAVVEAGTLFDCHPFPTEEFFRKQWKQGRITPADLDDLFPREMLEEIDEEALDFHDFRLFRLSHLFSIPSYPEVRYQLCEGNLLDNFRPGVPQKMRLQFCGDGEEGEALRLVWDLLFKSTPPKPVISSPRKMMLSSIHPFLIRFLGAYLDQGVSYWPMLRRGGLFPTFLQHYSQASGPQEKWLKGLAGKLKLQLEQGWTTERALEEGLNRLGISRENWSAECLRRGLELRGWAGMVRQMELRPDLAPIQSPPCRLLDYLAIYVQLEAHYREQRTEDDSSLPFPEHQDDLPLVYEKFVLAQLLGFGPDWLESPTFLRSFNDHVSELNNLERRRLSLLAYERHYLVSVLDALKGHYHQGEYCRPGKPRFQAVFCIDDREESLRRHLEEISPEVETFGYAGFFNIPMLYQALDDVHARPLCPVTITPKHLVKEVAVDSLRARRQAHRMRGLGFFQQSLRSSRNTAIPGLLVQVLGGFLAGIPLLGRTLFPGAFRHLDRGLKARMTGSVPTRLKIQRADSAGPESDGFWHGFTLREMTNLVKQALQTMGYQDLAPLFLVVGHGSASLNNPHEAAHDCGATGGGRGGPNARAFAAMANHPEVRAALQQEGLLIPQETWFVGGYHNTCDDTMEYYDLDLVPLHLAEDLEALQELMAHSCERDAHERCRRFENTPLDLTSQGAFRHVVGRAEELAQPRPEYGHCTNSLCLVGRRERTRGVFLDRRAFLVSYNPQQDKDGVVLGNLLRSVGPVGAGINLEYYFSAVDPSGYGCGTKLPHNVTGLMGIMNGHCSDLKTGLPWQMVEIHEPMRLLNIVEAEPRTLLKILTESPGLKTLLDNGWIHLVAQSPSDDRFWLYKEGLFQVYEPREVRIEVCAESVDHYGGKREHLSLAHVQAAVGEVRP